MRVIIGTLWIVLLVVSVAVLIGLMGLLKEAGATTYGPFPANVPPDTIDVTLPTTGFDMTGVPQPPLTCPVSPIVTLAATDTLEWVLWRGPADTVAVVTGMPGARVTFGVPNNWPPTPTTVFGAVRKKRGAVIRTIGGAVCQSDTYLLRGPMTIVWPVGVGAPTPR